MNIFDRYYQEYDAWYDKNENVFLTEINTIRKFELTGKGVEIGAGTGRFARELNIDYAVEPSLNMLKLARERGVKTVYSSGEFVPFEDAYFDFVLIVATLCFADDPQAILKEARRILKAGGRVIAGILSRNSIWRDYYKKKSSPFYTEAKFYSPEEIIRIFGQAGFLYTGAYQSLFSSPQQFTEIETPLPGYDKGGFVVLGALK